MKRFQALALEDAPIVTAPDGSTVIVLPATTLGSMARFVLRPGQVTHAVKHRSTEEIWHVLEGRGRIWRADEAGEAVLALRPGLSLTICVGTRFQFRCDGDVALTVLAITLPPWPGEGEAEHVEGPWEALVQR